ncbi:hypothetical protein, partial [Streptomyces sp. NPDC054865]
HLLGWGAPRPPLLPSPAAAGGFVRVRRLLGPAATWICDVQPTEVSRRLGAVWVTRSDTERLDTERNYRRVPP